MSEPEGSANWFPLNDYPTDKASFTFVVTVPAGLTAVSNGRLGGHRNRGRRTTWVWDAPEPMAPTWLRPPSGGSTCAATGPPRGCGCTTRSTRTCTTSRPTRRTRPIYPGSFFTDPLDGDLLLVHQWFGDSVALAEWKHMWLNEGFATYAEWLWGEREGLGTPQEVFDAYYREIPAGDPFWDVVVGDPGIPFLFSGPVYLRGAMTLQALHGQVGDRDFFRILRAWAAGRAGGNGTTGQFIALAERISGQQLDALFTTWLFTPAKPPPAAATATDSAARGQATPGYEVRRRPGRLRHRPAVMAYTTAWKVTPLSSTSASWSNTMPRRRITAVEGSSRDGLRSWSVKDKTFAWERPLRRGDLEALGDAAPDGPVLAARVPDLGAKEALLATDADVCFTTPHFNGYPAILVRLDRIAPPDLEELLAKAWLSRAPRRLAREYLDSGR